MIVPNLAAKPFLNVRPVWLVTAATGVLALVLAVMNITFYLGSTRETAVDVTRRDTLLVAKDALQTEVQKDVEALDRVPWGSLSNRVAATNLVLHEHAFSWIEMLDDLERVLPWNVRLIQISPNVGPEVVQLSLQVAASTRAALLELLDNMVADPRFSNPTPSREWTPEETSSTDYGLLFRVEYRPQRGVE